MKKLFVLLAVLCFTATQLQAQITPQAGDILAVEYQNGPTLIRYNQSGTQLQTITLTGTGPVGSVVGIAWLNDTLYINGTGNRIGTINLATGAYTDLFAAGSVSEGLGRSGTELVVLGYSTPSIAQSYTTTGTLTGTVNLTGSSGSTGIDSDATGWWVADYQSGIVRKFDFAGTQLSSFNPGLGTFALSDLTYDSTTNTLWISDGFGSNDRIYNFSTTGTLLSSFPATGFANINALTMVTAAVPEPTTLALFGVTGAAALGVVIHRRRKQSKR